MNILPAILLITPIYAFAIADPCVIPGSSVEIDMTRNIEKDLGFEANALASPKMELLSIEPVGKILAEQYAKADRAADFVRLGKYSLVYEDYLTSYFDDGAKTLLIKYTYENPAKQQNIFVASAIVNNNECSVRFNGYVIVKRDF